MEKIRTAKFDSEVFKLRLIEREAPTPSEKEITEDIPFDQGQQDYSMILGERVFDNRELKYEFTAFKVDYPERKALEQKIKRAAMMSGFTELFDSHDEGFYWLAKCKDVKVEDDEEYNKLTVNLTFIGRPFMYAENDFLEDNWDNLNFSHHAINFNQYSVDGELTIKLYNWGDRKVFPIVEVEGDI